MEECAVSILVGAAVGLAIVAFLRFFESVRSVFELAISLDRRLILVLVPLGIFGAYELVMQLAEIKRTGCGTHGFLEAYHFYEGFASLRDTAVKAAASALTIGFGGSAGLEGPSLTIGGGIASAIARLLRIPEEEVPHLFLAGGAAGLAAIFRTPLTGLLFALEIPYKRDLEKDVFVQAMLASVTSYLVFVAICGTETLFTLYPKALELTLASVLKATILGLLAGALGRAFVEFYERLGEKLVVMRERDALGAASTGRTRRSGYRTLRA